MDKYKRGSERNEEKTGVGETLLKSDLGVIVFRKNPTLAGPSHRTAVCLTVNGNLLVITPRTLPFTSIQVLAKI